MHCIANHGFRVRAGIAAPHYRSRRLTHEDPWPLTAFSRIKLSSILSSFAFSEGVHSFTQESFLTQLTTNPVLNINSMRRSKRISPANFDSLQPNIAQLAAPHLSPSDGLPIQTTQARRRPTWDGSHTQTPCSPIRPKTEPARWRG